VERFVEDENETIRETLYLLEAVYCGGVWIQVAVPLHFRQKGQL